MGDGIERTPQPTPVRTILHHPRVEPCHDAERLRKLRDGIIRNAEATLRHAEATSKAIDQVLAELASDEGRKTA